MSAAETAARLIAALEAGAEREAGAPCALVSVNVELLAPGADGEVSVALERKTRTLVFMRAALTGPGGAPIAAAASVHKAPG